MSVNFNLISATLDDSVHASIIADVKAIEAKLPFAITLTPEEKVSMRGLGLKSIDFIDKSYEYAVKNPGLSPQYLDMEEFGKDVKLVKQLQVLMQHLVPLTSKLKDTYSIVVHEAYNSSRSFYLNLKNASNSNTPGASAMVDELGKRFRAVRSSSTTKAKPSVSGSTKTSVVGTKKEEVTAESNE